MGAALVALAAGALIIQNKGGGQGAQDPVCKATLRFFKQHTQDNIYPGLLGFFRTTGSWEVSLNPKP